MRAWSWPHHSGGRNLRRQRRVRCRRRCSADRRGIACIRADDTATSAHHVGSARTGAAPRHRLGSDGANACGRAVLLAVGRGTAGAVFRRRRSAPGVAAAGGPRPPLTASRTCCIRVHWWQILASSLPDAHTVWVGDDPCAVTGNLTPTFGELVLTDGAVPIWLQPEIETARRPSAPDTPAPPGRLTMSNCSTWCLAAGIPLKHRPAGCGPRLLR